MVLTEKSALTGAMERVKRQLPIRQDAFALFNLSLPIRQITIALFKFYLPIRQNIHNMHIFKLPIRQIAIVQFSLPMRQIRRVINKKTTRKMEQLQLN